VCHVIYLAILMHDPQSLELCFSEDAWKIPWLSMHILDSSAHLFWGIRHFCLFLAS